MQNPANLEFNGLLQVNPLSELLAEAYSYRLSGSFRLTNDPNKVMIYLADGEVCYAVSNARQHRLFELLVNWQQATYADLSKIENFTNDLQLSKSLVEMGRFSAENLQVVVAQQIISILQSALSWQKGQWVFSPLARLKEDLKFKVNARKALANHARNLTPEKIGARFSGGQDLFSFSKNPPEGVDLQPHEAYIFSRIDQNSKIEDLKILTGMPEGQVLQSLYVLWFAGYLIRDNWHFAFAKDRLERILGASFKVSVPLIKPLEKIEAPIVEEDAAEAAPEVKEEEAKVKLEDETVEGFLARVELAENHYETLDIPKNTDIAEIKAIYFKLAKRFHPDKFHNEERDGIHQRLQQAFTQIAQAYETFKDPDARELYDFKLRRKQERAKAAEQDIAESTNPVEAKVTIDQRQTAQDYFDHGFSLLMEDRSEEAIPYFANATTLVPKIAKYHAYYGKSLSCNPKFRHQAEQEIQLAIKLEPDNSGFKILLAEFYIEFNLLKRAEGELQRLLAAEPKNKEARSLLDKLPKKQQ